VRVAAVPSISEAPMLPACSLVANAASKREASLTLLATIALLMVVVLVTAIVIVCLGRWTKRPLSGSATGESLSLFRSLYERGECSKEEYERIRAKLGKKLKQELQLPEQQTEEGRAPAAGPPPALAPEGDGGLDTSTKGANPGRTRPNDPDPSPPAAN
jgi:hypothetical protein